MHCVYFIFILLSLCLAKDEKKKKAEVAAGEKDEPIVCSDNDKDYIEVAQRNIFDVYNMIIGMEGLLNNEKTKSDINDKRFRYLSVYGKELLEASNELISNVICTEDKWWFIRFGTATADSAKNTQQRIDDYLSRLEEVEKKLDADKIEPQEAISPWIRYSMHVYSTQMHLLGIERVLAQAMSAKEELRRDEFLDKKTLENYITDAQGMIERSERNLQKYREKGNQEVDKITNEHQAEFRGALDFISKLVGSDGGLIKAKNELKKLETFKNNTNFEKVEEKIMQTEDSKEAIVATTPQEQKNSKEKTNQESNQGNQ